MHWRAQRLQRQEPHRAGGRRRICKQAAARGLAAGRAGAGARKAIADEVLARKRLAATQVQAAIGELALQA